MSHRTSLVASALLLALTMSGCQAAPNTQPAAEGPQAESTSAASPTTTAAEPAGVAPLDQLKIKLVPIARGFDQPLLVTHAGDGSGRLFVVEQAGRIRVVRDGKVTPRAYLDLSGSVSTGGERGLLGLAFAPDFETSGRLYVNYTDRDGDTVIERHVADDPASDTPAFEEPDIVFTAKQPYSNHNGGCIVFAPDGTLWVGMGDGGSAGDPGNRAQNPKTTLGKMISLDVEGPQDVPTRRVVMSGLRNPWRFSFDRKNNDVWIGDVGQNAWEEIDFTTLTEAEGRNWGWDRWEANHPYPPGSKRSRDGFSFPVIEYPASAGNSVTGGHVYRGSAYPAIDGVYFYGDFVRGWVAIARKAEDGSVTTRTVIDDGSVTPSSFGESEDGELYLCDYNGRLMQVTAR